MRVLTILYLSVAGLLALSSVVELVPKGMWGGGHVAEFSWRLMPPRALFRRLRSTFASLLTAVADALVWPVSRTSGLTSRSHPPPAEREIAQRAHAFLYPNLAGEAGLLLGVTVGIFLLGLVWPSPVPRWALLVGGIAVTLKLLGWLLSYNSFSLSLRRSAVARPYLIFLQLVIASGAVLLLAAHTSRLPVSAPFRFAMIETTFRELFLFQRIPYFLELFDFRTLASGLEGLRQAVPQLSAYDGLVGLSGLIFDLGLLRAVVEVRAFRRTSDDFCALAQLHLDVGEVARAEHWLARAQKGSLETEMVRVGLLLCSGRLQDAKSHYRDVWSLFHHCTPTDDVVSRGMLLLADHYAVQPADFADLGRQWFAATVSDASLLYVVDELDDSSLRALELDSLLAGTCQSLSLSRAALLWYRGEYAQAEGMLSTAAVNAPVEDVLRRLLLLQSRIPPEPILFLQELRRPFAAYREPHDWLERLGGAGKRRVNTLQLQGELDTWCGENWSAITRWVDGDRTRFERAVVGDHLRQLFYIARTLKHRSADAKRVYTTNREKLTLDPALPIHSNRALIAPDWWLL